MLSPADINDKQFATTRLKEGYDQQDVDDFLDRVQADYARLDDYVRRLEADNATLRRNASEAPTEVLRLETAPAPPSVVAERLLAAAEQAATEHKAQAVADGDEIVREAGAKGSKIIEDATDAAERIKNEGLAEKYRKIDELEAKERKLTVVVEKLVADGSQVRRAMQAALQQYDKEVAL